MLSGRQVSGGDKCPEESECSDAVQHGARAKPEALVEQAAMLKVGRRASRPQQWTRVDSFQSEATFEHLKSPQ